MSFSTGFHSSPARAMLAGTWGVVCALTLAAPILAAHSWHRAAALLYLSYASVCHQIPERSFSFCGYPLAVCHRCSGIYLGLFLGSLAGNPDMPRSPQTRRLRVLAAITPLLLDVLLPRIGLWVSTTPSRFLTGLILGTLISSLLLRGLAEFLEGLHAGSLRLPIHLSRGVFHE
jgi:uncharacterized membrane protein